MRSYRHPAGARAFSSTPASQATLRELEQRIKSVGNIGKITNMKDEMGDKLRMQFIRGRQAVITNELIDIITGASAL
ncbi:hypothetical protein JCM10213_006003 [Rhodosporidiobolus nylandii]